VGKGRAVAGGVMAPRGKTGIKLRTLQPYGCGRCYSAVQCGGVLKSTNNASHVNALSHSTRPLYTMKWLL
jgi:hypothetical protein